MAEKSVWSYLKSKFDFGCIERHEDMINLGVADTSYNFIDSYDAEDGVRYNRYSGWIELKNASFPKRESSKVKVEFEPMQKPWLSHRGRHGADTWVLLRVGRAYLLFYWLNIDQIGQVSYDELMQLADQIWPAGFTPIQLKNALMKRGA